MAKILIVDDSQSHLHHVKTLVDKEGYQVVTADSGESGLAAADAEIPDLILLDIVMPDMSGFQVIRKLRKNATTKQIPIIFITSKQQESDRVWGLRQGARAYITKPVDRNELLSAISSALAA